ncbi:MAG: bifunctional oligoribonuclease/PAP phosphatase NrnA [Clostridiaceae bacterium]
MIMNDILNEIQRSRRIAISFHISPDGDSLGSALALCKGLRKLGKDAYIISREAPPFNLTFLPGSGSIDGKTTTVLPSTDVVIILDCGDAARINGDIDIPNRKYTLIQMDHHLTNELYGDLNYVDTNSSAMSEIVYQMLNILGVALDKDIATCLYASIIADTGSFMYSSTTSITHAIAGHLINSGINFSSIHREVFGNKPYKRVKFIGKAIDNMELVSNERIAVFQLTIENFVESGIEPGIDTSDIINIGLDIDTSLVTVLLKEGTDMVKISLRSKSYVDVRKIAETFGGGGHTKAAGCVIKNIPLAEAKNMIIKEIEKELIA